MTPAERERELAWLSDYAKLLGKLWLDRNYDPAGMNVAKANMITNHLEKLNDITKE